MKTSCSSRRFQEALSIVSTAEGISATDVVAVTRQNFPGLIENVGALLVGQLSFDSQLIADLQKRQWMLCDFSNTNVGSIVLPDIGLIFSGTSITDDDSVIALPISPKKVLLFSSPKNQDLLRSVGLGRLALATIESAVEVSRNFVIANDDVNLNFLRRRFDQFAQRPV